MDKTIPIILFSEAIAVVLGKTEASQLLLLGSDIVSRLVEDFLPCPPDKFTKLTYHQLLGSLLLQSEQETKATERLRRGWSVSTERCLAHCPQFCFVSVQFASKSRTLCNFVEFDALSRLGIPDPVNYIKKRYKSLQLLFLKSSCVGQEIVDQVEASVDEAISSGTWVDIAVCSLLFISFHWLYFSKGVTAQVMTELLALAQGDFPRHAHYASSPNLLRVEQTSRLFGVRDLRMFRHAREILALPNIHHSATLSTTVCLQKDPGPILGISWWGHGGQIPCQRSCKNHCQSLPAAQNQMDQLSVYIRKLPVFLCGNRDYFMQLHRGKLYTTDLKQ